MIVVTVMISNLLRGHLHEKVLINSVGQLVGNFFFSPSDQYPFQCFVNIPEVPVTGEFAIYQDSWRMAYMRMELSPFSMTFA
jgi:hypothetical protein